MASYSFSKQSHMSFYSKNVDPIVSALSATLYEVSAETTLTLRMETENQHHCAAISRRLVLGSESRQSMSSVDYHHRLYSFQLQYRPIHPQAPLRRLRWTDVDNVPMRVGARADESGARRGADMASQLTVQALDCPFRTQLLPVRLQGDAEPPKRPKSAFLCFLSHYR